jgi:hypothetical protein
MADAHRQFVCDENVLTGCVGTTPDFSEVRAIAFAASQRAD